MDTDRLAASLDVSLASHGVCPACFCEIAWDREHSDARVQRRTYAEFAPNLWLEGLGETVRRALVVAAHDDVPGAAEALADLESRGLRSGVFSRSRQSTRRRARQGDAPCPRRIAQLNRA